MANDKTVNVLLNVVPGPDQLSPQARQQKQALDDLNKAKEQVGQQKPAALAAPDQGKVAGVASQLGQLASAAGLGGVGSTLQKTQSAIDALGQSRGPAALQGQLTAAKQGAGGLGSAIGGVGGALGGVGGALGTAIPIVGAMTAGLGAAAMIGEQLSHIFTRMRDDMASLVAMNQQFRSDLDASRQTGQTSADQLRRTLTAAEGEELIREQGRGNMQGQRAVLARAEARLRGEAVAGGGGERVAALRRDLDALENFLRGGGGPEVRELTPQMRQALAGLSVEEMRQAVLRFHEIPEGSIPAIPGGPMLPEARQALANLASLGSVGGQAGLSLVQNILRPGGIMPSLRPGAPEQPSGLFQSRTGDVLDIHEMVQTESLRDQREQQRFEALVRLLDEWREEQRRLNANPPAPVG